VSPRWILTRGRETTVFPAAPECATSCAMGLACLPRCPNLLRRGGPVEPERRRRHSRARRRMICSASAATTRPLGAGLTGCGGAVECGRRSFRPAKRATRPPWSCECGLSVGTGAVACGLWVPRPRKRTMPMHPKSKLLARRSRPHLAKESHEPRRKYPMETKFQWKHGN
jgi:hypothetical protein